MREGDAACAKGVTVSLIVRLLPYLHIFDYFFSIRIRVLYLQLFPSHICYNLIILQDLQLYMSGYFRQHRVSMYIEGYGVVLVGE